MERLTTGDWRRLCGSIAGKGRRGDGRKKMRERKNIFIFNFRLYLLHNSFLNYILFIKYKNVFIF